MATRVMRSPDGDPEAVAVDESMPNEVIDSTRAPRPPTRGASAHPDGLSLRAEGQRKVIHLASAVIPVLVWVLPRPASIGLLGAIVATALAVEVARRFVPSIRDIFLRLTGGLLRTTERTDLSGATWMAIAYLVAVVVFPLPVAVAAMLYNAFGDGLAAVVGKRWGRHRVPGGKSLEGAGAGFAANLLVGLAIPGISPLAAVIGGGGTALLELLPIPVNDNLVVTIGGGALVWMALGG